MSDTNPIRAALSKAGAATTMFCHWLLSDRQSHTLSGAFLFLLAIFFVYGVPILGSNEGVYLVKGRQLIDPGFLAADWTVGEASSDPHGLAFSILSAPVWLLIQDPVLVAVTLRLLIWLAFAAAFTSFLRAFRLPVLPAYLGLTLWILQGQMFLAGEWLVGDAEQKTIAYIALLLALRYCVNGRWLAMATWLACSIWFHILVGGWGALAVFTALLFQPRLIRPVELVKYGAICGILVSPALLMAIAEVLRDSDSGQYNSLDIAYASSAQMMVEFRVPHHLDPSFFVSTAGTYALLLFTSGLALALSFVPMARSQKRFLTGFLLCSGTIAGIGYLAFLTDQFWFLQLYPFRLADGVIPLMSWVLLPAGLLTTIATPFVRDYRKIVLFVVVLFGLVAWAAPNIYRTGVSAALAWQNYLSPTQPEDKSRMYEWIRANTRPEQVFLAPPWLGDFHLSTERPMLVSIRAIPQNERALSWFERLRAANDYEDFSGRGFDVLPELKSNYRQISTAHLACIRERYGTSFYLTEHRREDLANQLVFATNSLYLYDMLSGPVADPAQCLESVQVPE